MNKLKRVGVCSDLISHLFTKKKNNLINNIIVTYYNHTIGMYNFNLVCLWHIFLLMPKYSVCFFFIIIIKFCLSFCFQVNIIAMILWKVQICTTNVCSCRKYIVINFFLLIYLYVGTVWVAFILKYILQIGRQFVTVLCPPSLI